LDADDRQEAEKDIRGREDWKNVAELLVNNFCHVLDGDVVSEVGKTLGEDGSEDCEGAKGCLQG